MGNCWRNRAFSIIEVLIVMAIVAILASMSYSAIHRGRRVSKEATCLNNLKQIAVALNLYFNDHKTYPSEALRDLLARYVGDNPNLFICPCDPDPQGDSYSCFYVARPEQIAQGYVCGCPRHVDESSTVTLFSSASTHLLELRKAYWNGQPVAPGTSVGSGVLTFEDGSKVTIPTGMVTRLIQSFRTHDGRFYTLIGVGINEMGTLDIEVTPGSRFEVVTPAAIAGVQGTRFKVTTFVDNDNFGTKVDVTEGEVAVANRWVPLPSQAVAAGKSTQVETRRAEVVRRMPKHWLRRRIQLLDDWRFERL